MPDRTHVETSLPCDNHGCRGFLKCHGGSKLIAFDHRIARKRVRVCEMCGCTIETIEFRTRLIKRGNPLNSGTEVLREECGGRLF